MNKNLKFGLFALIMFAGNNSAMFATGSEAGDPEPLLEGDETSMMDMVKANHKYVAGVAVAGSTVGYFGLGLQQGHSASDLGLLLVGQNEKNEKNEAVDSDGEAYSKNLMMFRNAIWATAGGSVVCYSGNLIYSKVSSSEEDEEEEE